jgi:outer membrane protein assembly factor BamA
MTYIHIVMSVARACILMISCLLLHWSAGAQVADVGEALLYSTREEIALKEPAAIFTVKEIRLDGNRRTRNAIIFRELSFSLEQQLPLNELAEQLNESHKRLMNTGLFLDVVVTLSSLRGYDAYVKIELRERWYIYPMPFLRMVDRNLNQWMNDKNMDFSRVNYGIKFTHKNTTGRRDRTTLNLMNGYTRAIGFSYQGLFLDKKMKWSASLGASTGHNKEINYMTEGNRQIAYKNNEDFVHSYFRGFAEVSYRPAIFTTHTFGFRFNSEHFADTVLRINPNYSFNNDKVKQPEIYYNLAYFNVDFIPYPTKGLIANLTVNKRGLQRPLNMWQLNLKTSASWPITPKSFFNLRTAGTLKLTL